VPAGRPSPGRQGNVARFSVMTCDHFDEGRAPDTLPAPLATRYRAAVRTEGASPRGLRGTGPGDEERRNVARSSQVLASELIGKAFTYATLVAKIQRLLRRAA
jgi:hypothetical protein